MSGGPRLRFLKVTDNSESRAVLFPSENKVQPLALSCKLASKPLKKVDTTRGRSVESNGDQKNSQSPTANMPPVSPSLSAPSVIRRHEMLIRSNLSLNASCSSDASTDSFCSRASTGRIGRHSFSSRVRRQTATKTEKIAAKLEMIAPDVVSVPPDDIFQGKRRCSWVTLNTDPCYVAFHDEEWGVPVHCDKKLFELLVLCGALAELTWPVILSRRHKFREVFMDFDPVLVSKLNEKKVVAPGSAASGLLSEPKLRGIIENAREIPKIVEEFGSFDNYFWSFVNHKPIVSRFRYPRQVPVKTPKADLISKDLVRRGFRGVGPTVVYSFMQAAGITNDHLISCFRSEECNAASISTNSDRCNALPLSPNVKEKVDGSNDVGVGIDLELSRAVAEMSISS